jgi:transposase
MGECGCVSCAQKRPSSNVWLPGEGKQRAIMAVAHAIVVSAFHRLSRHEPYRELGPNYLDERRRNHLVDSLTRRIQHLGYRVQLEPVRTAE